VHPERVWTNGGAQAGDVLVLTKPIGTGVISTALKRGIASEEHVEGSIRSMLTLNWAPAVAHGCTDITGFGLLGHAREMAIASGVTLEIDVDTIPFLPGAVEYARAGAIPGGSKNNREFVSSCVLPHGQIAPEIEALLYDPQTSGGLLISSPEPQPGGVVVGRVTAAQHKADPTSMSDHKPIIIALDVETAEQARTLVAQLGTEVDFYKVGLELYASAGYRLCV
jgi:selenide,water dikinase